MEDPVGAESLCGTWGGSQRWGSDSGCRGGCSGLWLRRLGQPPCTELKGAKALWELLGAAAGWPLLPSLRPGKHLSFWLVFFFFPQSWKGAERREGLVGLREPTRVNKLRESRSTQNLLSQGGLGWFKFNRHVGGKYLLSFFPVSLDPREILKALNPRGPHQPGLWGESSSPGLPQPPPQQAG